MKTFTTKEVFSGTQIFMTDENGTVWSVPNDPDNTDYKAYLASLTPSE